MAKTIKEVYDANPSATAPGTSLVYLGLSPFGIGDDSAILMTDFQNQFTGNLKPKAGCRLATTTTLSASYNNGSSGVGATLTNAGALAALVLDGVTVAVGDRVLVKNQSSQLQNGIYTVSVVGSGAANWVLIRATDFDTTTKVALGSYTVIAGGTQNAGVVFVQSNTVSVTIGVTAITFVDQSASSFSPANTLYAMTNGSASGDGSLDNPYAKTSQAIAGAVVLGASNTNRYSIITYPGNYEETTNLELYRPGIFHTFLDGVRLSMTSETFENYFIAVGWEGVAGAVCGVRGLTPILLGGCDVNIPYNGITQILMWDCNFNAATDVMNFTVNNSPSPPASQSFLVLYNCDIQITQSVGFDVVMNTCRGALSPVVGGGYPDTNIYLNGGTYLTSFGGATEIASGAAANLNIFLTSAFVGAVSLSNNRPTGQVYFNASPGQYGTILRGISGGASVPPEVIIQTDGTYATADGAMLASNFQFYTDITRAGAGRFFMKSKDPGGNVFRSSVCSPVNCRVTQGSAQTITNNTLTTLTLDTEAFDISGYFASNTFTPLMPGKFQIGFQGAYVAPAVAIDMEFHIYKNGAAVATAYLDVLTAKNGTITLNYLDDLAANDAIQIKTKFTGNAAANLNINNAAAVTYFYAYRVSD